MKTIPVPLTRKEIRANIVCLRKLHQLGNKLEMNDDQMQKFYYSLIGKLEAAIEVYDEEAQIECSSYVKAGKVIDCNCGECF